MGQEERKKNGMGIMIVVMLIITVLAVSITIWALFFREAGVIEPTYAPVELEPNAELLEEDDEEVLEAPEGGGAVSIVYTTSVGVDLSQGIVSLFYENPSKSTQDAVVQIVIQDVIIAESGRLEAGYGIKELSLLDSAILSQGIYEGEMVVMYYNPETGEKAMVNTEIPVEIEVYE